MVAKNGMRIHLTGVGGVAMGNLAAMLREIGHTVTGSDVALYPPMSDRLRDWGIEVLPFDAKNVQSADLCIIGNVISRGNVEVEAILNDGIEYTSMSEAIARFFLKRKKVIVVAGTHGKTTTTFLIDHLLSQLEGPPGLFVGGIRADGFPGWRVGDSDYFVIEGDEYDTAFFDKHSKFLHYRPTYLVLTSIEFDHADIFRNMEEYLLQFRRLLRLVPSNGRVVACADYPHVRDILANHTFSPVLYYGSDDSSGATFRRAGKRIDFNGIASCDSFPLFGAHNGANALAALLVLRECGFEPDAITKAMESFPGVLRRQQIRVDRTATGGTPITLIEDFAHHPTAVRKTLESIRDAYPERAIHALFEPRSATSHRNIFEAEYGDAFSCADHVFITDVFNPEKVNESERLDVRKLIETIRTKKPEKAHVEFAADPSALLQNFTEGFLPSPGGDVIVVMSNGAFGGIYPKLDEFVKGI